MNKPTTHLLLIGHGSRDAAATAEYNHFAKLVAQRLQLPVQPCFLEFADPPIVAGIRTCVAAGAEHIVALPLFLGPAGHQKNDVPTIINWARTEWPQLSFTYGTPLGSQPQIIDVLAQRAQEAIAASSTNIPAEDTALILVGRGSRDPDSNSDVYKLARMLWEGRNYGWVEPAFYSLTQPDIESAIARCVKLGARRVVSLPYLLFTGVIRRRLDERLLAAQQHYPDLELLTAEHLSSHTGTLEAVVYRYTQAIAGEAAMTCDLCKYRHMFSGFETEHGLPQSSDHHHGLRGVDEDGHHHHHHHSLASPTAITTDSFAIIRQELAGRGHHFEPAQAAIIERIIHSTADFEFAEVTRFSQRAIEAGIAALHHGCAVVTDVNMVRTGISQSRLAAFGGTLHCFVAEEITRQRAKAEQTTRSAMGIGLAAEQGLLAGSIVVIGNAPTALFEVISLIDAGLRPALVIGVPVGFVSTVESKNALLKLNTVPWLTTLGRKGGSAVAVAIINALLRLAADAPATEVD